MLALGLAVVVFFAFVAGLALVAAVFAVFALGAALVLVTFGLVSVFSFLGAAAFFSAAGFASFFASLTGPEGPEKDESAYEDPPKQHGIDLPFGWEKSPLSTPLFSALLNRESNCVSEVTVTLLLALTYFLIPCRLAKSQFMFIGQATTMSH